MSIVKRMKAPTPRFFKVLRTAGITLAAVAGALLTAPVSLPALVLTIASYVAVAGTVITAVSQATVVNEADIPTEPEESMKES